MREDEKSKIDLLPNIRTQLSKIAIILCAMFVFAVAMAVKSNACTFQDCKKYSPLGYNDSRISLIGPPDEAIIKRAVKIIRQCDPTLLRHEQCWMLRRRQACKQAVAAIRDNRAPTLGVECHRLLVHAEEVVNAK